MISLARSMVRDDFAALSDTESYRIVQGLSIRYVWQDLHILIEWCLLFPSLSITNPNEHAWWPRKGRLELEAETVMQGDLCEPCREPGLSNRADTMKLIIDLQYLLLNDHIHCCWNAIDGLLSPDTDTLGPNKNFASWGLKIQCSNLAW